MRARAAAARTIGRAVAAARASDYRRCCGRPGRRSRRPLCGGLVRLQCIASTKSNSGLERVRLDGCINLGGFDSIRFIRFDSRRWAGWCCVGRLRYSRRRRIPSACRFEEVASRHDAGGMCCSVGTILAIGGDGLSHTNPPDGRTIALAACDAPAFGLLLGSHPHLGSVASRKQHARVGAGVLLRVPFFGRPERGQGSAPSQLGFCGEWGFGPRGFTWMEMHGGGWGGVARRLLGRFGWL